MNTLAFLTAIFFTFTAATSLAYNPSLNTTVIPYEVYVADSNVKAQAEYLGELIGDPQMYEFTIGADTTLKLRVLQLKANNPTPFSLIAVKQNNQNAGVIEIGRLKAKDIVWEEKCDGILGLTFLQSSIFEAKIGPGVYRVEVSTPDNFGSYMLQIGDEEVVPGYFKTLGHIHQMQSFFGKNIFHMLQSAYLYYPLGIVILVSLIYQTWRKRKLFQKHYA